MVTFKKAEVAKKAATGATGGVDGLKGNSLFQKKFGAKFLEHNDALGQKFKKMQTLGKKEMAADNLNSNLLMINGDPNETTGSPRNGAKSVRSPRMNNPKDIKYDEANTIKVNYEKNEFTGENETLQIQAEPEGEYQFKTQGSVAVKKLQQKQKLTDSHVDDQIELRKSQMAVGMDQQSAPDAFFTAQKIKMVFKRTQQDESLLDKFWAVVDIPLNFFRDFTVPMAE